MAEMYAKIALYIMRGKGDLRSVDRLVVAAARHKEDVAHEALA